MKKLLPARQRRFSSAVLVNNYSEAGLQFLVFKYRQCRYYVHVCKLYAFISELPF
ncbi:hypothetical protein OCK74_09345 [Chitinophagaceae bacterium LB-8]|uniref:Uncharacterized protein n=1 Tax=Paraflavisolibacter caeni TaxID=2982496 RepID=A0A9X2XU83_9BACT|nr:hypothetical protein [Paraflavisolibacter caeni]MCU7549319.1 hypothetical protein [Paraflavisolibacter caeni]